MKNIFIAKYNAMTAANRATAEGKLMRKKALAMKLASGMTFSSALKLESDLMKAESINAIDRIIDSVESSQALAEDEE
jgi:type II secretory pathway component PulF